MRVTRESFNFAKWLLEIGKGIIERTMEEKNLEEDFVVLPRECIVDKEELVKEVFGTKKSPAEMRKYAHRAILTLSLIHISEPTRPY